MRIRKRCEAHKKASNQQQIVTKCCLVLLFILVVVVVVVVVVLLVRLYSLYFALEVVGGSELAKMDVINLEENGM